MPRITPTRSSRSPSHPPSITHTRPPAQSPRRETRSTSPRRPGSTSGSSGTAYPARRSQLAMTGSAWSPTSTRCKFHSTRWRRLSTLELIARPSTSAYDHSFSSVAVDVANVARRRIPQCARSASGAYRSEHSAELAPVPMTTAIGFGLPSSAGPTRASATTQLVWWFRTVRRPRSRIGRRPGSVRHGRVALRRGVGLRGARGMPRVCLGR